MYTVDHSKLDKAIKGLDRFADDVRREGLKRLAAMVKQQTRERFETKKGPDRKRWSKWSKSYAKTRSPRHSVLVATGLLRRTISVRSSSKGIRISSPRTYAAAVQDERPFLGIGKSDVRPIERALGSWAKGEMARRVGR